VDAAEITKQILGAWDEVQGEEENAGVVDEVEQAEPEPEEEEELEEEEEPAEEEENEEEEVEEETDEGEDEGEEEEPEEEEESVGYQSDDIEVRAYLAKYDNDIEKALKGAAEIAHLISRQGQEKNLALARVAELEGELERLRFSANTGIALNDEQRQWLDEAIESGNPAVYVQQAVDANELGLARALCHEWAREDPYSATRAGARIDELEQQAKAYVEPVNVRLLVDSLKKEVPDMVAFEGDMVDLLGKLGEGHHLVQAARSQDLYTAAQGIYGIYELAKLSSVNLQGARAKVKADQRSNGASARKKAVVSSGSASPSAAGTPRTVRLGPGLTLEQLEAEFANANS